MTTKSRLAYGPFGDGDAVPIDRLACSFALRSHERAGGVIFLVDEFALTYQGMIRKIIGKVNLVYEIFLSKKVVFPPASVVFPQTFIW